MNGGKTIGTGCALRLFMAGALFVQPTRKYRAVDLGTLSTSHSDSIANGINNRGHMVGSPFSIGTDQARLAFLWQNGTMAALDLSPNIAVDLNDRGEIVGHHAANGAWIWSRGTVTWLGPLGGARAIALAVNKCIQVAGSAGYPRTQAHLWRRGIFTRLGSLVSYNETQALEINARGLIVGYR